MMDKIMNYGRFLSALGSRRVENICQSHEGTAHNSTTERPFKIDNFLQVLVVTASHATLLRLLT